MSTKKRTFDAISNYRNTEVDETEAGVSVTLYSTEIFRLDREKGTVRLDNGGWSTDTTKRRMNECLLAAGVEASVYQEDYEWYVRTPEGETEAFEGRTYVLDL